MLRIEILPNESKYFHDKMFSMAADTAGIHRRMKWSLDKSYHSGQGKMDCIDIRGLNYQVEQFLNRYRFAPKNSPYCPLENIGDGKKKKQPLITWKYWEVYSKGSPALETNGKGVTKLRQKNKKVWKLWWNGIRDWTCSQSTVLKQFCGEKERREWENEVILLTRT